MTINIKYFREYREKLGFTSQQNTKTFFAAKDIVPTVDYNYIESLNDRLFEILEKINALVVYDIKNHDLSSFYEENISKVFKRLRDNGIIHKLNNQGRRPEEVYFSWMRGFVISVYFKKALSSIFDVSIDDIDFIWDDDLEYIETFKRTPKADLQIRLDNSNIIRIEVQSWFQWINDIKQHKVLEAKNIKAKEWISSMVIHFDLFNGQVAFVELDEIEEDNINWITRQQMEWQTVFNIDQNYFVWKLTEEPIKYRNLFSSNFIVC